MDDVTQEKFNAESECGENITKSRESSDVIAKGNAAHVDWLLQRFTAVR